MWIKALVKYQNMKKRKEKRKNEKIINLIDKTSQKFQDPKGKQRLSELGNINFF